MAVKTSVGGCGLSCTSVKFQSAMTPLYKLCKIFQSVNIIAFLINYMDGNSISSFFPIVATVCFL